MKIAITNPHPTVRLVSHVSDLKAGEIGTSWKFGVQYVYLGLGNNEFACVQPFDSIVSPVRLDDAKMLRINPAPPGFTITFTVE